MESKITTNFEAKTEQKINNPSDFGGLPSVIDNFFDWKTTNQGYLETNYGLNFPGASTK